MIGRPLAVAPVGGFSAVVLAGALAERLPGLAAQAEAGRIHPEYLAELRHTHAALSEVAAQWRLWRQALAEAEALAAVDGSAAVLAAAALQDSVAEIDTQLVATVLRVSPNRVRQLCRAGRLRARKAGRTWLVPVGEVRTLEVQRGQL